MGGVDFTACQRMNLQARRQVYQRLSAQDDFVSALIEELGAGSEYHGIASWFLKHHLEQGACLSADHVSHIYTLAARIEDWEAMLHLLQCLPSIGIPRASREWAELFVRRGLDSKNKFVRAWAYNGFNELAVNFPAYRKEAADMFADALQHEAASVKARVRNLRKF